jgi:hypothetical protein
MALCNTVIPIKRLYLCPCCTNTPQHILVHLPYFAYFFNLSPSGAISYKAQSQDEDALVNAASNLHVVLVSKNGNNAGRFLYISPWSPGL